MPWLQPRLLLYAVVVQSLDEFSIACEIAALARLAKANTGLRWRQQQLTVRVAATTVVLLTLTCVGTFPQCALPLCLSLPCAPKCAGIVGSNSGSGSVFAVCVFFRKN